MTDNTKLSFTANILVNNKALITLNDAIKGHGDVVMEYPENTYDQDGNPNLLNISRTLGIFTDLFDPDSISDENLYLPEAEQDKVSGSTNYRRIENLSPAVFYFRYSEAGYRIYIRSGQDAGHGVFKSQHGIPMVYPIDDREPSLWHIKLANTSNPVVLSDIDTVVTSVHIECPLTGASMATKYTVLDPNNTLTIRAYKPTTTMRLYILERNVD